MPLAVGVDTAGRPGRLEVAALVRSASSPDSGSHRSAEGSLRVGSPVDLHFEGEVAEAEVQHLGCRLRHR